jgi:protocatechuate 3,4-dioxygenase beta subunit
MVPPMKPFLLSTDACAASAPRRRDFLAWMLAVPAVAGCTVANQNDGAATPNDMPGAPAVDAAANDGHAADDGDVAMMEEEWKSCSPTTRDAEGPYFQAGSPQRALQIAETGEPGVRLLVEGHLVGPDCKALKGYSVDVWQADATGNYYDAATSSYRLRGKVVTDTLGRYRFETILPARYTDAGGTRPAHLHWKILTPQGNTLLTTQLYFAGDPWLGQADYCTRARTCNSSDVKRALALADAVVSGQAGKKARFDAFLSRS